MRALFLLSLSSGLISMVLAVSAQQPGLPEGVTIHRDLAYVENGHERQRLDLYLPADSGQPLPLVVWIHGGAWLAGSKEDGGPARDFASKGYAVASINYRLSQHARFPAQIEDCMSAIQWLRKNAGTYRIDANSVAVWGGSAGGHLAALVGTAGGANVFKTPDPEETTSTRVQAVIDWFGPTDFIQFGNALDNPDSPEARLIGGPIQDNMEAAASANPITHISAEDPPFLIMHGTQDSTVPFSQSELLVNALRKAGVEVTFQPVAGAGHGGSQFVNQENRAMIDAFLEKHLKKHPAPAPQ
ncbi:MAG: alpha/beta hydrolase fold domain-containing protein [Verrucomicrobiota bacterium]